MSGEHTDRLTAFTNRYRTSGALKKLDPAALERFLSSAVRFVSDELFAHMVSGYAFMRFDAINDAIRRAHSQAAMELGKAGLFTMRQSLLEQETCFVDESNQYLLDRRESLSERLSYLEYLLLSCSSCFSGAWPEIETHLNSFLRAAELALVYRDRTFRLVDDERLADEVHRPFWEIVEGDTWGNVRDDMSEAVRQRDAGGPNPSFFAARALESAIKIVSDRKGWTTGRERGAAHFIDNLLPERNGRFIDAWEADMLKRFFTDVRNPDAHGAGAKPQPKLRREQTAWAIAFCMIWIRSLVERL